MLFCPCCDRECLNEDESIRSLSHLDSKTTICITCGQKESMVNLAPETCDVVDLEMYNRFKERLNKK
jgi:hypothetical protein